jgi:N-hydroxyarylamine O-acetyltransferase
MFLTVIIGGATYVVDPGFGPFTCPLPIPIDGTPVPASAPTHRLAHEGNDWFLYVTRDGEQIQGWVSTMEEEYPVDFDMMNHYIATHPASFFTRNILASAVTQEGRVSIMNQGVNIVRNGAVEPTQLADRKALRAIVAQHFGFDLPRTRDNARGWRARMAIGQRSCTLVSCRVRQRCAVLNKIARAS